MGCHKHCTDYCLQKLGLYVPDFACLIPTLHPEHIKKKLQCFHYFNIFNYNVFIILILSKCCDLFFDKKGYNIFV